ncbi:hypothetical protein ICN48_10875 [Polynucleobacter sp. JS-Safj-400b-B2]|uniref:hypothetical protein n=1 Tax=Polynucleobacter sp. JS-Safj-400b-B2 TaxID=2576921 RepID=UPI001C0D0B0F|nr:hypothetical protein [Polynucleobacter sp. JS-Safj-400b-B2]MBU3626734.1 hypothetical protein [Polynucleobacter sp. JS-Safj-400b-B2]
MIEITADEKYSLLRISRVMTSEPQILTAEDLAHENDPQVLKNLLIYYSEENYILRKKIVDLYLENAEIPKK